MKRSRRWVPILSGVVAFVVAAALLSAVIADWALRNQEMDALVSAVEQSESQMIWAQESVGLVVDEATDPASGADPEAVDAQLQGIAAEGRDRIRAAGDAVAQVNISPWHQDLLLARQAYLEHSLAWQDYLDRAATNVEEFSLPQDAVNTTFLAAEPLFRNAIPSPDGFSISERVDLIFAEPEPETDQGPTQQASLAS